MDMLIKLLFPRTVNSTRSTSVKGAELFLHREHCPEGWMSTSLLHGHGDGFPLPSITPSFDRQDKEVNEFHYDDREMTQL